MKFVSLRTKRAHHQCKLGDPQRTTLEPLTQPSRVPHQAHTYAELRQQIHHDLRIQHPDWIQPNGECPKCDAYEARLTEMLGPLTGTTDDHSVGAPAALTFEHGLN